MRTFTGYILCIIILMPAQKGWADQRELIQASLLVPVDYQKKVLSALKKSGKNGRELIRAVEELAPPQREGLAFLLSYMPGRDLVALKTDFLVSDVRLAYQAVNEVPWGKDIPKDLFLNDILPYASFNERRDNWREDFHRRFIEAAKGAKTIDQAVMALNKTVFGDLQVSYSATKRPKPDQSPYESAQAHYASCTGLSILLADALRSVGIPARIAGIAAWHDNHTWVEIWDGKWHFIGADEPAALDHAWFADKASRTDHRHPICAVSYKKTGLKYPMPWAPGLHFVHAIDVTERYTHIPKQQLH